MHPDSAADVGEEWACPTIIALADCLHRALGAESCPPEERGGVLCSGDGRRIARLGLSLDSWPTLGDWAARERLDALFLHRPWRLAPGALAPHVGVVWSHLHFDERLTTGDNPWLASALGMRTREPLGEKAGRPLGMIGDVVPCLTRDLVTRVRAAFGGSEQEHVPDPAAPLARIAVVGAMTDALVREAAARGAGLYVTGQLRQPARAAVAETGIAVIAVGHARAEWWGARTLGRLMVERWHGLTAVTAPMR